MNKRSVRVGAAAASGFYTVVAEERRVKRRFELERPKLSRFSGHQKSDSRCCASKLFLPKVLQVGGVPGLVSLTVAIGTDVVFDT
jgi:hypothetical protein